jgi:AcrR family transcriptional regulator
VATTPLTIDTIVATSRTLLVEGGPDAVVVREVARRLGVTAPALYRYVRGRDDLLTLLITACTDEATAACEDALRSCRPGDVEGRIRTATLAFRAWALDHRPEFGLVYGTPLMHYAAPEDGPTVAAGQRFGSLFGSLFVEALGAGRLRAVDDDTLAPGVRASLAATASHLGLPMHPGEVRPFIVGWHRMLGIVSVEVAGHLRWVFGEDASAFAHEQIDDLLADLLVPAAPEGGCGVRSPAAECGEYPPRGES